MYTVDATRDVAPMRGLGGHLGELRQGPDGQLYEWMEGIDGLGHPIGFWNLFKLVESAREGAGRAARAVKHAAQRVDSCSRRVDQIDAAQAARHNRTDARRRGWLAHRGDIERFLKFTGKPDDMAFARGVARWQCGQGLDVDGVLGRNTWRRMRAAGAVTTSTQPAETTVEIMPQGPFGTVTILAPERYRFSYTFTPEDALWLARFIKGESGGQDDLDSHAVIWAAINRFAFFTHAGSYWNERAGYRGRASLAQHVQAYSTTLQPVLNSVKAARRAIGYARTKPHKFQYVETGGFYPGTNVPKGQLKHHLEKIRKMTWKRMGAETRSVVVRALRGQVESPIGLASEFANTATYFKQNRGRPPKTDKEWRDYTKSLKNKKWTWVGHIEGLHQRRSNAFFLDNRIKDLPEDSIRIQVSQKPATPKPRTPKPRLSRPTAPKTQPRSGDDPWLKAIRLFDGRVVDPMSFPKTRDGFQDYLDATGVRFFSAKEMTAPHIARTARRLGYRLLLPEREWWPRGAALAKLADTLRTLIGRSVKMRNWWRPRDYNKAVGGASGSDHIPAQGVDLDYRSAEDRVRAEREIRRLRREHPWLRLSLGVGCRTTHVGLLTGRGERSWPYKSLRRCVRGMAA